MEYCNILNVMTAFSGSQGLMMTIRNSPLVHEIIEYCAQGTDVFTPKG